MSALERFLADYEFPSFSSNEKEWDTHFTTFKVALRAFWKSQGIVTEW